MDEKFLQYIWQYQLFDNKNLKTVNGEKISIVTQGSINNNAGPDFFNSKIKIKDTVWAGNIEIHYKSSDWYKHKHDKDKAYNSVILHVVVQYDTEVYTDTGQIIPTLILPINEKLQDNYKTLVYNSDFPACLPYLQYIPSLIKKQQINRATIERLERKIKDIQFVAETTKNNWAIILYRLLGKYFGTKINTLPFEMLTKKLPLSYLAKHKNSLFQIEALLFGAAGFLKENGKKDKYYLLLQKEWNFLSVKFKLASLNLSMWKFSKLRPANFPTIRIAQFAAIIFYSENLFSKIIEINDISVLQSLFLVKPSSYWDTHYLFSVRNSRQQPKIPGKQFINTLIINVIIPIVFAYGSYINDNDLKNKALSWMESLPAERNKITEKYQLAGFQIENAFISQGLLTLYEKYCTKLNCLNCQIGHRIIKRIV